MYAQHEITPFVGYQTGGSVTLNDLNTPIEDAPVFGVTLTWDRGPHRKLDVLLSHESTKAERHDPFEPPLRADIGINYGQIGGRYVFDPVDRLEGYIAITFGGTYVTVNNGQGLRFSVAGGGGADINLSPKMAIRLDGRFTTTFVETSGSLGCSSISGSLTCIGLATGGALTQFTASAGLVFHY